MEIKEKSTIRKISLLTLGLLIDIKERISTLVHSLDGTAQPKLKEPDEETPGFEGILPESENKPDGWAQTDGQPSSEVVISEEADSDPSYTGNPENVFPDEFTSDEKEPWQDQLDPSTDEDIPLRPSEVEIPHEIQYDQEDDLRIITPAQGEPEVEIPEEDFEVENPQEKEFDPEKLSGDRKTRGRNKGK